MIDVGISNACNGEYRISIIVNSNICLPRKYVLILLGYISVRYMLSVLFQYMFTFVVIFGQIVLLSIFKML